MEMELIIPDKIAMMADLLGCDVLVIRTIQRFIKLGAVGDALDYANDTIGGNGVYYKHHVDDGNKQERGLAYIDKPGMTIVYSHEHKKFCCAKLKSAIKAFGYNDTDLGLTPRGKRRTQ